VKNKRKVEGKLKNLIIIARGSNVACFLTGIACNQNTKKKNGSAYPLRGWKNLFTSKKARSKYIKK